MTNNMSVKEIHFAGTPDEISAQWHTQRDKGVGGSDVGVIMNLSMWKSVEQLWAEKYGHVKPEDISHKPCVILGNALEPALREEYAYRHPDVQVEEPQCMFQDTEHPWRQASLDGIITCPDGMKEVLEIKTVGWSSSYLWGSGRVPDSYACQVLHYMAVTGYRRAQIIAMIGNTRIIERTVERDEYLIKLIEREVDEFWQSVEKGKQPRSRNPPAGFLERLRNVCYGPADPVQGGGKLTGHGRCGEWLGIISE